jgi:hypothetical protein
MTLDTTVDFNTGVAFIVSFVALVTARNVMSRTVELQFAHGGVYSLSG